MIVYCDAFLVHYFGHPSLDRVRQVSLFHLVLDIQLDAAVRSTVFQFCVVLCLHADAGMWQSRARAHALVCTLALAINVIKTNEV
jgi:hypothetical protein